ncbi:MAG: preprotein translocase subunit YajC [Chlamydiae bacterium]|jgi:preprotein translocase subunit YajC|nr:preprotein translocase subunit YajC [Chlamydiota bacterium]
MNMLNIILAQEAVKTQDMTQTLIMLAVIMGAFYLILWRPEQKKRKELDKKKASMQKGDKVIAMGIVGHVHKILDTTVVLNMVDGSKIEVLKGAITEIIPLSQASVETEKKD